MDESMTRKVLDQFHKEYDFMYEHDRTAYVAGYDKALEYGDRLIARTGGEGTALGMRGSGSSSRGSAEIPDIDT